LDINSSKRNAIEDTSRGTNQEKYGQKSISEDLNEPAFDLVKPKNKLNSS
jgi:hypothetical protein